MIEITVNGKKSFIPDSFGELKPRHIRTFFKLVGTNISPEDLRIHFAFLLVKLPKFQILKLKALWERHPEIYHDEYENMISALATLSDGLTFLTGIRHIEKRPFKWIGFRVGPSVNFKNITVYEFAMAEKFYRDFNCTEDKADIQRMASVLYRRPSVLKCIKAIFNKSDDVRVSLSNKFYPLRMNDWKTAALHAWFTTFTKSLPSKYPLTFEKGKKDELSGSNQSPWGDIIMALSGDIPGKEEDVANMPFFTILERLEFNARRIKDL